jgi:ATP-dependent Clp protease ATP-binding subunit ClpC
VALREAVERLNGESLEPASEPQFGKEARRVLLAALEQRDNLGHDHLGTEHVLLALLHESGAPAVVALTSIGVDAQGVREQVLARLTT